MADTDPAPAALTAYDLPGHHDGTPPMSREEHLQAIGEHILGAHAAHDLHAGHMDALSAHADAIRDEDGRGGDGERSAPPMPWSRGLDSVRANPQTARTLAALRGRRQP